MLTLHRFNTTTREKKGAEFPDLLGSIEATGLIQNSVLAVENSKLQNTAH